MCSIRWLQILCTCILPCISVAAYSQFACQIAQQDSVEDYLAGLERLTATRCLGIGVDNDELAESVRTLVVRASGQLEFARQEPLQTAIELLLADARARSSEMASDDWRTYYDIFVQELREAELDVNSPFRPDYRGPVYWDSYDHRFFVQRGNQALINYESALRVHCEDTTSERCRFAVAQILQLHRYSALTRDVLAHEARPRL